MTSSRATPAHGQPFCDIPAITYPRSARYDEANGCLLQRAIQPGLTA